MPFPPHEVAWAQAILAAVDSGKALAKSIRPGERLYPKCTVDFSAAGISERQRDQIRSDFMRCFKQTFSAEMKVRAGRMREEADTLEATLIWDAYAPIPGMSGSDFNQGSGG